VRAFYLFIFYKNTHTNMHDKFRPEEQKLNSNKDSNKK